MDCLNNLGTRCTINGNPCTQKTVESCMWTVEYTPETWCDYTEILELLEVE